MSLLAGWYLWQRMMLALGLGAVAALGLAPMSLWLATIGALLALPALFLGRRDGVRRPGRDGPLPPAISDTHWPGLLNRFWWMWRVMAGWRRLRWC